MFQVLKKKKLFLESAFRKAKQFSNGERALIINYAQLFFSELKGEHSYFQFKTLLLT